MKNLLVTGSSGLTGFETSHYFAARGWKIHGLANNQRAVFFGSQGDTRWNQQRRASSIRGFEHHQLDLREREGIRALVRHVKPDAIVCAAAQPSHDKAAEIPFEDFDTDVVGKLNLLEAGRRSCPEAPFVHMSTNKACGDRPNQNALHKFETRWDRDEPVFAKGIAEDFPMDQSKHSLFGASKLAGDILVQEYGRYMDMTTCCLRGGCLTGRERGHTYLDQHRSGDHICYYSDLSKLRNHYPSWDISISLNDTIEQVVAGHKSRLEYST